MAQNDENGGEYYQVSGEGRIGHYGRRTWSEMSKIPPFLSFGALPFKMRPNIESLPIRRVWNSYQSVESCCI